MNCIGFEMSINLCLVRSSGQRPSCNNALGSRAALPGRREPRLSWQAGQGPRQSCCFLLTVNSRLVNFDVTVHTASSSQGSALEIYVQLSQPCSSCSPKGKESPIPPYWNGWDSHVWNRESGGRTGVPTHGWGLSTHQPIALTCSWEFRIYWPLLCPALVWTSFFRLQ